MMQIHRAGPRTHSAVEDRSPPQRTLRLLAGAAMLLPLLLPSVAAADDITIELTAEVAWVDHCEDAFAGINPGDTISASFTYDSATPDTNALPTVGDYPQTSAPYGMQIEAGGKTFSTSASWTGWGFLVEIVNDHPAGAPYASDHIVVRSYVNDSIGGVNVEHISWQLDDSTMTALDSTDLPTAAPVLADWEQNFGLNIDVSCGCDVCPFTGPLEFLCDIAWQQTCTSTGMLRAFADTAVLGGTCEDTDADAVCDDVDNCAAVPNADQLDTDSDGAGDVCDAFPCDADDDLDGDGVGGDVDLCPDTVASDAAAGVPSRSLKSNRWVDSDGDGVFEQASPGNGGPAGGISVTDTWGCSCADIIDALGLGNGHTKYGCSSGAMDEWLEETLELLQTNTSECLDLP